MICVNLLPEHLQHAASRHLRRGRVTAWIIIATLSLLAWGGVAWTQIRDMNQQIVRLQERLRPAHEQMRVMDRLRTTHQQLASEQRLFESLRDPIPPASILALLSQLTPQDVVVKELTIDVPTPNLAQRSKRQHRNNLKSAKPDSITIRFTADAPSETSIATLMDRLSRNEALADFRLISNQETHQGNDACYVVLISFGIPLSPQPDTALASGEPRP